MGAFDKIAAGLEDAIAFANGDESRGRVIANIDVKAIRKSAHKTQMEFATAYHIPVGTVRDWEQARRQPDAPARVLLSLIEKDPVGIERMIASEPGSLAAKSMAHGATT
ncbi:Xre family transcriptional regulator [Novosphingobium sp. PhB165]|uniref:helix-turn-helix domain-containing protein n=1 Tax=Novosphingobium sp. PhB165 TaxID=2485105 RepID=UPI001048CBCA|nr:transcriptional regulator [Novosphingobium sp. PhB165]TCM17223.1 Xre family transcriptional regulator [Novosphingobium sp. PhB165]